MLDMEKAYRPGLNFIRFYAAFSVLIFHIINNPHVWFGDDLIAPYLQSIFLNGEDAVELFFVLSGFLITHLMLIEIERTGRFSPKEFYVRRVLRILPLYFLTAVIGLVLVPMVFSDSLGLPPRDLTSILAVVFLLPNTVYGFLWKHVLAHLWSIGVEEQFYAMYPLLVRLKKNLPSILLGMIAARWILLLGAQLFENNFWSVFSLKWRFDCIGIGGLAACAVRSRSPWLKVVFHPCSEIVTLVGVVSMLLWPAMRSIEFDFLRAIVFAVHIMNVSSNPHSLLCVESPLATYLGNLSYPIYMLHPFVIFSMRHVLFGSMYYELAMILGCLAGTLLVAAISYRFFETPFLTLKARFKTT